MIKFREWYNEEQLIESFEIKDNYKRLSKSEADKYWMKIFNTSEDQLPGLYSSKSQLKCYIVKNEEREYFIYSYIDNSFFEIHFIDVDIKIDGKENSNKGLTKNSQPVFGAVMSIVLKELEERPLRKIKISAPEGRETLYKKIIDKTLKKYNIEKDIKITKTQDNGEIKHHFLLERLGCTKFIFIELTSSNEEF